MTKTKHWNKYGACFVERLEQALKQPELRFFEHKAILNNDLEDVDKAACETASALGWCRLSNTEPPDELDGSLQPPLAMAACRGLERLLTSALQGLNRIGTDWDAALLSGNEEEADILCLDAFEDITDAFCALQAIEEALWACWPNSELEQSREKAILKFQACSDAFYHQRRLLALVVSHRLICNFKTALENNACLVWWLDGTIETATHEFM